MFVSVRIRNFSEHTLFKVRAGEQWMVFKYTQTQTK